MQIPHFISMSARVLNYFFLNFRKRFPAQQIHNFIFFEHHQFCLVSNEMFKINCLVSNLCIRTIEQYSNLWLQLIEQIFEDIFVTVPQNF